MASDTEQNDTRPRANQAEGRPDAERDAPVEQTADQREAAERYEAIRQLALAGELEHPPEAEEIVETLLDTIAQRDEIQSRLLRAAADHQNYQRRAANNEREARELGVRGVVSSLIPLIDQFEMAMAQDPARVSGETIVLGVKMIRDEFLRVLAGYGVAPIAPDIGDEFNPGDHEAMMQQPAEGVEPGCVSMVMSTGYKLGDRVVRPAKVGVAPQRETGPAPTKSEDA
ncbi:MAG: nucleotide exchange factor GrpE [Phycisphaerales bacterium]|nr:nucleotide exchange factor GrpE [Planctomycetota bacterium]MCH8507883.1 nucleotide exchange factor GrpE [Phycisphaerales bacterium]